MLRYLLTVVLSGCSLLALAQNATISLKDGAYRENGVVMRLKAGQATRLEGPLKLDDGSVMNPSGILVRKSGTRQLLPNGQAVNMQGNVVNLHDDMQTAEAIDQRNQTVAGSRGEYSVTIKAEPADAATVERLQQTERRVALLQQLTDKLADRTAQAVGTAPGAAALDTKLRALDTKP